MIDLHDYVGFRMGACRKLSYCVVMVAPRHGTVLVEAETRNCDILRGNRLSHELTQNLCLLSFGDQQICNAGSLKEFKSFLEDFIKNLGFWSLRELLFVVRPALFMSTLLCEAV